MDIAIEIFRTVAGGIVAAILTLVLNNRRLNNDLERAGRTLAIQLTDVFERYALACAAIPGQHGSIRRDNPHDYEGIAALPAVPDLPTDESGWRALDTGLAIDARTFQTRRQQSGDVLNSAADYGDADDVENEVEVQALRLGNAAWKLSSKLRSRYGLGKTHIDWDINQHFIDEFSRIEARNTEQALQLAAMPRIDDEV